MRRAIGKHIGRLILAASAMLLCSAGAFCQQATEPDASDESLQNRILELIGDLESPSFEQRERASKELIAIGEPAVVELARIPPGAVYELRHRAKTIRNEINDSVFDLLSRQFLLDLDGSKSYGLPGWRAFRSMVGSSRSSKQLFLDMVREQRALLELIETVGSPDASDIQRQAANTQLAVAAAVQAASMEQRLYELPSPPIGENMGLLFAAAVLQEPSPMQVSQVITRVAQVSFYGYARKQGYGDCLRALMSAWVPKANASLAPEVMRVALDMNLATIVPTARRTLSRNFDVTSRELAFKCLAKFGDETDVESLSIYFDDLTVVEEFIESSGAIIVSEERPPGVGPDLTPELDRNQREQPPTRIVRICDLAVAASMLLLKQDPRTLFPNFSPDGIELNSQALSVTEAESPKHIAKIKTWAKAITGHGNES